MENFRDIDFQSAANQVLICYKKTVDRLCGQMVRVPGYRTQMYCVSCEVRTDFIYVT
jgi:hypothetical protein